jgi:hypothetical protein
MRGFLACALAACVFAANPLAAQTMVVEQEPIPVPEDAPHGSSGPVLGSAASGGSMALGLIGLVVVVAIGAVAVAAND